jgi:hypothetical protein
MPSQLRLHSRGRDGGNPTPLPAGTAVTSNGKCAAPPIRIHARKLSTASAVGASSVAAVIASCMVALSRSKPGTPCTDAHASVAVAWGTLLVLPNALHALAPRKVSPDTATCNTFQ